MPCDVTVAREGGGWATGGPCAPFSVTRLTGAVWRPRAPGAARGVSCWRVSIFSRVRAVRVSCTAGSPVRSPPQGAPACGRLGGGGLGSGPGGRCPSGEPPPASQGPTRRAPGRRFGLRPSFPCSRRVVRPGWGGGLAFAGAGGGGGWSVVSGFPVSRASACPVSSARIHPTAFRSVCLRPSWPLGSGAGGGGVLRVGGLGHASWGAPGRRSASSPWGQRLPVGGSPGRRAAAVGLGCHLRFRLRGNWGCGGGGVLEVGR